jgi:hypothetical protein
MSEQDCIAGEEKAMTYEFHKNSEFRFEVLTAVKMPILVFWVVNASIFRAKDGRSMFLRNGICLQGVTTQKTNISREFTEQLLWK